MIKIFGSVVAAAAGLRPSAAPGRLGGLLFGAARADCNGTLEVSSSKQHVTSNFRASRTKLLTTAHSHAE
jgi:hypothetical protein